MNFRISCTFSHLGKKESIKYKNYIIDVSEFEGTEQEHHSGTFEDVIEVEAEENKTLIDHVKEYIKKNDLTGECFTISVLDILLFTEEQITI